MQKKQLSSTTQYLKDPLVHVVYAAKELEQISRIKTLVEMERVLCVWLELPDGV